MCCTQDFKSALIQWRTHSKNLIFYSIASICFKTRTDSLKPMLLLKQKKAYQHFMCDFIEPWFDVDGEGSSRHVSHQNQPEHEDHVAQGFANDRKIPSDTRLCWVAMLPFTRLDSPKRCHQQQCGQSSLTTHSFVLGEIDVSYGVVTQALLFLSAALSYELTLTQQARAKWTPYIILFWDR